MVAAGAPTDALDGTGSSPCPGFTNAKTLLEPPKVYRIMAFWATFSGFWVIILPTFGVGSR